MSEPQSRIHPGKIRDANCSILAARPYPKWRTLSSRRACHKIAAWPSLWTAVRTTAVVSIPRMLHYISFCGSTFHLGAHLQCVARFRGTSPSAYTVVTLAAWYLVEAPSRAWLGILFSKLCLSR